MENIGSSLKKLKIELLYDSNTTSRYSPEENENTNWERYVHPCIHCSIIYNSQDIEMTYREFPGGLVVRIPGFSAQKKE